MGGGRAGRRRGAARGLRVSLGVQSFSPDLREALGRRAQADPAEAFGRLRRAGVANLSLDLIHGIPGQTAAGLEADIAAALDLRPAHISWYELGLAPGTPLAARTADSRDEDAGAAFYRRIVQALSRARATTGTR